MLADGRWDLTRRLRGLILVYGFEVHRNCVEISVKLAIQAGFRLGACCI